MLGKYVNMVVDAFETANDIRGTLSGGLDAPRIMLGVEAEGNVVKMRWKNPRTCGLSDCVYHYIDTSEHTDEYMIIGGNNKDFLYLNGSKEVFDTDDFEPAEELAKAFYDKWGLAA